MPAASPIRQQTETVVGDTGSGNYRQAQSVVAAAATLKDAVQNSPFLDGMEPHHRTETLAVLDALPPDVDRAFMASLRDALQANKSIAFEWREGAFAHEAMTDEDGTVHLWLQCPRGDTFTATS